MDPTSWMLPQGLARTTIPRSGFLFRLGCTFQALSRLDLSCARSCHDAHLWIHHADLCIYIYLFMAAAAASLCAVGKQPSSEPNKKGSEQIIDLAIGQQPQIERLLVTSSSSYDHMGCIEILFMVGPVRFLNPESWSTDCKVCINNESFALCDINRNMLSLSGP